MQSTRKLTSSANDAPSFKKINTSVSPFVSASTTLSPGSASAPVSVPNSSVFPDCSGISVSGSVSSHQSCPLSCQNSVFVVSVSASGKPGVSALDSPLSFSCSDPDVSSVIGSASEYPGVLPVSSSVTAISGALPVSSSVTAISGALPVSSSVPAVSGALPVSSSVPAASGTLPSFVSIPNAPDVLPVSHSCFLFSFIPPFFSVWILSCFPVSIPASPCAATCTGRAGVIAITTAKIPAAMRRLMNFSDFMTSSPPSSI